MRRPDEDQPPRTTTATRRRALLRRVFVAVLLLLLADTAIWAFLCQRLEQGLRDAVVAARLDGWSIAAERVRWSGWPFAAALDLTSVAAASTLLPDFVWQAQNARLQLALFHPTTLTIRIAGPQSIAARGIPPITLKADRALIDADLTGATPPHASIGALKATLPAGTLTLDRAELTFPINDVVADLAGLSLPTVAAPIGALHLHAAIDPALPVAATPEMSARAWHQAGGHIDITEIALQWNALAAAGFGRITLDDHLQPHAEGSVTATGLASFLDDLAKAGTLAPAQAGAAKAVVAILAAPSGGERVQLPILLEDGTLRLARFPLVRFEPLAWE